MSDELTGNEPQFNEPTEITGREPVIRCNWIDELLDDLRSRFTGEQLQAMVLGTAWRQDERMREIVEGRARPPVYTGMLRRSLWPTHDND